MKKTIWLIILLTIAVGFSLSLNYIIAFDPPIATPPNYNAHPPFYNQADDPTKYIWTPKAVGVAGNLFVDGVVQLFKNTAGYETVECTPLLVGRIMYDGSSEERNKPYVCVDDSTSPTLASWVPLADSSEGADTVPTNFDFVDLRGRNVDTEYESEIKQVLNFYPPLDAKVRITNGSAAVSVSLRCGATAIPDATWTNWVGPDTPCRVKAEDYIQIKLTTSPDIDKHNEVLFTLGDSVKGINATWDVLTFSNCGVITDVRGDETINYTTVRMPDGKCWMAENLRATKYQDGRDLVKGFKVDGYYRNSAELYCNYNNADCNPFNPNPTIYGYLYDNYASLAGDTPYYGNEVQGICPDGWHLPSDQEFGNLVSILGSTANSQMKDSTTCGAVDTNCAATQFRSFFPGTIELISYRWPLAYYNTWVSYYTSNREGQYGVNPVVYTLGKNETIVRRQVKTDDYTQDFSRGWGVAFSVRCVENESDISNIQITGFKDKLNVEQERTYYATTTVTGIVNPDTILALVEINDYNGQVKCEGSTWTDKCIVNNNEEVVIRLTTKQRVDFEHLIKFQLGNILVDWKVMTDSTPANCGILQDQRGTEYFEYETVLMPDGSCWMREDLKTKKDAAGYSIDGSVTAYPATAKGGEECFCGGACNSDRIAGDDCGMIDGFSYLFTPYYWQGLSFIYTTKDTKIQVPCPYGWHLPSYNEFYSIMTHYNTLSNTEKGYFLDNFFMKYNNHHIFGGTGATDWRPNFASYLSSYNPVSNAFYIFTFDKRTHTPPSFSEYDVTGSNNHVRCVKGDVPGPRLDLFSFTNKTIEPQGDWEYSEPVTVTGVFTDLTVTDDKDFANINCGGRGWADSCVLNPGETLQARILSYYFEDYSQTVRITAGNRYVDWTVATTKYPDCSSNGSGPATVKDLEDRSYRTRAMPDGTCWMRDNLMTTKKPDGTALAFYGYPANATDGTECYTWGSWDGVAGEDCYDKDKTAFYEIATVLNGQAGSNLVPSGVRGICPVGWHLPSQAELDNKLLVQLNAKAPYNQNSSIKFFADTVRAGNALWSQPLTNPTSWSSRQSRIGIWLANGNGVRNNDNGAIYYYASYEYLKGLAVKCVKDYP